MLIKVDEKKEKEKIQRQSLLLALRSMHGDLKNILSHWWHDGQNGNTVHAMKREITMRALRRFDATIKRTRQNTEGNSINN